jgi:type VI secretion system secreted protein VgrG
MPPLDLNQAEFLFQSEALARVSLLVHQFSGRESLSRPFEFQIDLVCDNPDLDLEEPIGQPACLTLRGRQLDGSRYSRYVHGVIERFIQVGAGVRQSRYQATLVPTIKPLAFTRNSRIFQKQSSPDVTQKVLKDDRIPSDWISTMLHGSYGARDYCVQYQESDLNFIQRLWEEEGIFYFFEHESDKDKLVLGDGGHAFSDLSAYRTAQLRDKPHLYEECLFEFRAESALHPGATILRDFKFKQPTLDMEATAQADRFADYKMYFFPGEYVDPALGERFAQLRLEELQSQKSRYVGVGSVRAMLPGHKFSLVGHRRGDCNQEYLILSVEHRGTQPAALGEEGAATQEAAYQNRVECIPAKVPFRPARETPRPSILGIQSAVVVGPQGEEIYCDEHGRVKAQFHWDRESKRDDNSSCWIRVSQPWAGVGWGIVFLPRIGQEVLVHFIEGDPDRPVIIGCVYNGENPFPYSLPGDKTKSTIKSNSSPGGGGYNELRFEDATGREEVYLQAQKDLNELVKNNHSTTVGANQKNTVGANQTESIGANQTVSVGANQSLSVGANQSISVKGNRSITVSGKETTSITGTRTNTVTGDVTNTFQSNQKTDITGNDTLTVTGNQSVTVNGGQASLTVTSIYKVDATAEIQIQAPAKITLTCGDSTITMTPSAIDIKSTTINVHGTGVVTVTGDGAAHIISKTQVDADGGGAKLSLNSCVAELNGSTVNVAGKSALDASGGGASLKLNGDAELKGGTVNLNP